MENGFGFLTVKISHSQIGKRVNQIALPTTMVLRTAFIYGTLGDIGGMIANVSISFMLCVKNKRRGVKIMERNLELKGITSCHSAAFLLSFQQPMDVRK